MIFFVTVGGKSSSYGFSVGVSVFKMKLKCLSLIGQSKWEQGGIFIWKNFRTESLVLYQVATSHVSLSTMCAHCVMQQSTSYHVRSVEIGRLQKFIGKSGTCKYVKENLAHANLPAKTKIEDIQF